MYLINWQELRSAGVRHEWRIETDKITYSAVKILLGEAGFTVKRYRQKLINVQLKQQIMYRNLGTSFTEIAWLSNTNPAAPSTETFIEPESEIVILKRNSASVRIMRTGLMCWLTAGGVTGMIWQRSAINNIHPRTKCSSPAASYSVFRFYSSLAGDFLLEVTNLTFRHRASSM